MRKDKSPRGPLHTHTTVIISGAADLLHQSSEGHFRQQPGQMRSGLCLLVVAGCSALLPGAPLPQRSAVVANVRRAGAASMCATTAQSFVQTEMRRTPQHCVQPLSLCVRTPSERFHTVCASLHRLIQPVPHANTTSARQLHLGTAATLSARQHHLSTAANLSAPTPAPAPPLRPPQGRQ